MAGKRKGFTTSQRETIENMAREGSSFTEIASKVDAPYTEVQQYCWVSGCLNWQGTKKMISLRLNRLQQKTTSESQRKQSIQEIQEHVRYLYYCARGLQRKVEAARNALG